MKLISVFSSDRVASSITQRTFRCFMFSSLASCVVLGVVEWIGIWLICLSAVPSVTTHSMYIHIYFSLSFSIHCTNAIVGIAVFIRSCIFPRWLHFFHRSVNDRCANVLRRCFWKLGKWICSLIMYRVGFFGWYFGLCFYFSVICNTVDVWSIVQRMYFLLNFLVHIVDGLMMQFCLLIENIYSSSLYWITTHN